MTISLKHTKTATVPNIGGADIGRDEWNQEHVLTIGASRLLGRGSASTGAAEEIAVSGTLTLAAGTLTGTGVSSVSGTGTVNGITLTGTVTAAGDLTLGGTLSYGNGTAAAPSVFPTADTNTGIYFPAADQVAVSTGGAGRVIVNENGNVGIGGSPYDADPGNGVELCIDGPVFSEIDFKIAGVGSGSIWAEAGQFNFLASADSEFRFRTINGTDVGVFTITKEGLFGYALGGGAVTQATSRTTGVTLDAVCGAITLTSDAGSISWASFTVSNSMVSPTDTVIVNQKSGTDLYEIHVTNVAAGSFQISYRTTGGTTTEQPVFNFSIIKAVTA